MFQVDDSMKRGRSGAGIAGTARSSNLLVPPLDRGLQHHGPARHVGATAPDA